MRRLITLLVLSLLITLTSCKTTAYIVPIIQEPIVQQAPTHEPWEFTAIDDNNAVISMNDLKILTKYIVALQNYADAGWTWVQYYIDELRTITEDFKK